MASGTTLLGSTITGSSNPTGPAGGDLAGTYPNPTVVQVSGIIIQPLTTVARLALSPSNGEIVYDTNLHCLFIYNVSRWFPASPVDPISGFLISEDWSNNNIAGNTTWAVTGNTGSDSGAIFDGNTDAIGQVYLEQANGSNGYTTLYYGNSYALAAQSMFFDVRAYVSALSTGAQEYIVDLGFGDQVDATEMNEGIFFAYDRATDGDFWSCKTANSNAITKTVTAVAPTAGTYQLFSAYATASSVKFYISGTLVATHTTNIPTALVAPKLRIVKTNGSTARRVTNDFFTTYSFFNVRRT